MKECRDGDGDGQQVFHPAGLDQAACRSCFLGPRRPCTHSNPSAHASRVHVASACGRLPRRRGWCWHVYICVFCLPSPFYCLLIHMNIKCFASVFRGLLAVTLLLGASTRSVLSFFYSCVIYANRYVNHMCLFGFGSRLFRLIPRWCVLVVSLEFVCFVN